MTKKDILKKYKMTEQEFYKKFPTQEAFQKFEMGGSLNNTVVTGGPTTIKQKPSITVSDPNDPRLKSYQDSLSLNQGYFKDVNKLKAELAEDGRKLNRTGSIPLNIYENRSLYDSDKIKPASIVQFGSDGVDYAWGFPYYVPPVQPYNLKPKTEVNTTPQKPVEAKIKRKFDKMPILPFRGTEVSKNQLEPNLQAREVPQIKTSNIKDSNVYTASKMLGKLGKSTGYTNKGMNQGREENTEFKMGGSLFPKQRFLPGGVTPLPVDPSVMQNLTKTVPTFGNGAGGAVGASAGGAASGLGSAAGPAASAISAVPELIQGAKQPSGPEKGKTVGKTIGSTVGGIGGAVAGSILLPGVGTVIGGMLGSTLGGMAGGGIGKMVGNQNQEFKQETNQFKMGGDFTDFKGNTHEDGGTTFPGTNIEVEKNETKAKLPDGRKVIFTNSLDIPYKGKRTYAQEHRSIEKKYFRTDLVDSNTKKRLIPKLFEDQEMKKEIKKEQMQAMMLTDLKNQYMMYGGKLKMAPGGELPTELANLAVQGMGDAYNIYQGAQGADPVNFERMNTKYQYADPRGAMDVANRQVTSVYNNAKNAVRNTTTSAGEYLANMTNLSSKEAADRANYITDVKSKYDISNTQGLNQSNLMKNEYNARTQMAESVARQQEQDAARSSISTGLSGLGAKVGGFNNAKSSWNNQNNLLSLMHSKGYYPILKDGKMGWTRDGVTVTEEPNVPSGFTPPTEPPPPSNPPKKGK